MNGLTRPQGIRAHRKVYELFRQRHLIRLLFYMVCNESTCVFKIKVKDNISDLLCVRYSVIIQDVDSAPISG